MQSRQPLENHVNLDAIKRSTETKISAKTDTETKTLAETVAETETQVIFMPIFINYCKQMTLVKRKNEMGKWKIGYTVKSATRVLEFRLQFLI